MTLLDSALSSAFLAQYKRLLGAVAGQLLMTAIDYNKARDVLYDKGFNKTYVFDSSYEESFVHAVKGAIVGMFIYAKKYAHGYAFKDSTDRWLCVKALTTPLEEMIPAWSVVNTAVLPYHGFLVCDGLVVDRHVAIGPNMVASMTQELKAARKKWSILRNEGSA